MLRLPRFLPYRTLTRNLHKCTFKAGDEVFGYQVQRVVDVPEFDLRTFELVHKKTGSKHLHLERDDSNNAFNVMVRTVPKDDTGIAHILEHVVLCGSEKYPVRDPFFKMLDRSMSSFMNAMTGPDYTMYPFATQNSKDYKNLLSVYLDAVFFPRIRELDFLQEGWRLEHENLEDKNSPIIFKGVVFNEMKGYVGNSSHLMGSALTKYLLPDHTYACSYGGEPLAIPKLTWEQLCKFHHDHFHPSNAIFMTYGDMPLKNHLEAIDSHVMQHFEEIDPETAIPAQPRWTQPRTQTITCPPDKMAANPEKQAAYTVSYLLPEISDVYESFVASFVCALLTDGPSAPLYKALVESGKGSSYSPMTGYYGRLREGVFSCGLQGINEKDGDWVEQEVIATITKTVKEGFPNERVEALLHQIELDMKHQRSQFGLGLTFSILPVWSHGADPMTTLQVKEIIGQLRNNIKSSEGKYLQAKTSEFFLGNTHRLGLLMKVDPDFNKKLEDEEAKLLAEKVSNLSENSKKEILRQGTELQKMQNEAEDLNCLPGVKLADIPISVMRHTAHREVKQAPVYVNEQPTNGVTYFNLIMPINHLNDELHSYLPLFASCLTEMGTKQEDYERFAQRQELYTGGLKASVSAQARHDNPQTYEMCLQLSSHCLDRNTVEMFRLWKDLWLGSTFRNETRLQTLISQRAQGLANGLAMSGHTYAMKHAAQGLTPSSYFSELFRGVNQINFMKDLAAKEQTPHTSMMLSRIADRIFAGNKAARMSINTTSQFKPDALNHLENFIEDTGLSSFASGSDFDWRQGDIKLPYKERDEITLPLAVNFNSTCMETVPYSHEDNPSLRVLARLMSTKYLHREIREKGGAYGSGARQGADGVWSFFSYRDPNVDRTFESFQNGIQWAIDAKFSDSELEEAKVALFQGIDSPVAPPSRGLNYFSSQLDNSTIQLHRERIIKATRDDIVSAATNYLKGASKRSSTVIGPAASGAQKAKENQA